MTGHITVRCQVCGQTWLTPQAHHESGATRCPVASCGSRAVGRIEPRNGWHRDARCECGEPLHGIPATVTSEVRVWAEQCPCGRRWVWAMRWDPKAQRSIWAPREAQPMEACEHPPTRMGIIPSDAAPMDGPGCPTCWTGADDARRALDDLDKTRPVGCGECGHRWAMTFADYVAAVGLTCPECGSRAVALVLEAPDDGR
jgi:ribosomal protein S27E